MKSIIELIAKRNKEGKILKMSDIKYIQNRLCSLYAINLSGIELDNRGNYLMSYYINNNTLKVNYEKIKHHSCVTLNNYQLLFAIVHELRHCIQYHYSLTGSDNIAYIYLTCFDWIASNNPLSQAFYSQNHDYFPVEMNANIIATLFVLYVTKSLGDYEYYQIFLENLENRIKLMYSNRINDVLVSLFEKDEINEFCDSMDEYNQFINGILNDQQKCIDIKQMLLLNNFN